MKCKSCETDFTPKDKRQKCCSISCSHKVKPSAKKWKYNREYELQRHYGISVEEYNLLFERQQGKCAICHLSTKLHVDHCHTTGKVRGLLCEKCNRGLGLFNDNVFRLSHAMEYLSGR